MYSLLNLHNKVVKIQENAKQLITNTSILYVNIFTFIFSQLFIKATKYAEMIGENLQQKFNSKKYEGKTTSFSTSKLVFNLRLLMKQNITQRW